MSNRVGDGLLPDAKEGIRNAERDLNLLAVNRSLDSDATSVHHSLGRLPKSPGEAFTLDVAGTESGDVSPRLHVSEAYKINGRLQL